jgi:very-short-patch-repair endonuclease
MTFQLILKSFDLPAAVTEHRFHVERKWRFDFAWPDLKVAVEVEGGIWTGGRHTRGAGFLKDMEKYNHAAAAGWCILRCTPTTLMSGPMLDLLARVLRERLSKVAV